MNLSANLVFVLVLTVQCVCATKCPSNPGKWCENIEIAKACAVIVLVLF
jgi:hypothetical protein